jgi:hypothetical protein
MNHDIPPATASPEVPATSLVNRLLNIFVTPGDVFAEVRTRSVNHQHWLVPALLFLLASWCAAGLMFSQESIRHQVTDMQDEVIQKRLQKQIDEGKITQAQVDQIKASAGKMAGVGQIIGFVITPIMAAGLTPFWGGFVLWAGAVWIFKRPIEYLKCVEITGLAMMIEAVGALVKGLICAGMGNMFTGPGPSLLVKHYDPSSLPHNLLLVLDVFLLWALAVRAVGLAKLCEVTAVKAVAWVLGVWVTITGGMLLLSWAAQKAVAVATGQH